MAKLKNSFTGKSSLKPPVLGASIPSPGSASKVTAAQDLAARIVNPSSARSVVQALKFGAVHTKITGSGGGSQWESLLSSAASGGLASTIGGGILSSGAFGFIGKLLNLFGGGKSTPAVPMPFVMPASQQVSLNIGGESSASSVSLGVHSALTTGGQGGPIYQQTSSGPEHAAQSAQVVQIVKQALLTSSSLNDIISEI